MTETWSIALIGFALTIMTAFLGWMATALWGINKNLREFITKTECGEKMGVHCNEIDKLRKIAEQNQKGISQIVTAIKLKHNIDIEY